MQKIKSEFTTLEHVTLPETASSTHHTGKQNCLETKIFRKCFKSTKKDIKILNDHDLTWGYWTNDSNQMSTGHTNYYF